MSIDLGKCVELAVIASHIKSKFIWFVNFSLLLE